RHDHAHPLPAHPDAPRPLAAELARGPRSRPPEPAPATRGARSGRDVNPRRCRALPPARGPRRASPACSRGSRADRPRAQPTPRPAAPAPARPSIPAGAAPYRPPEVTDEHRRLARADLERIAQGPDPLGAELATSALENQERLDEFIRAWFGVAHSFARLSPLSEPSLNRAGAAHRHAVGLWHSRHSSVVIRTSYPTGYDVWRGIGSMMQRVGHAETYEAAEQIGVARVRELREQTMARIRDEILDGWSPETPYYSATLSSAATELPITV